MMTTATLIKENILIDGGIQFRGLVLYQYGRKAWWHTSRHGAGEGI